MRKRTLAATILALCMGVNVDPGSYEAPTAPSSGAVIHSSVDDPALHVRMMLSFWEYIPDPDHDEIYTDEWNSLSCSMTRGGGECDDYAIASMAILEDFGYPRYMLAVKPHLRKMRFPGTDITLTVVGDGHGVHLLERDGLYGLVGINDIDQIEPYCSSLEDLFLEWKYLEDFAEPSVKYMIIDFTGIDIYDGNDNLCAAMKEYLENLDYTEMPWTPLVLSGSTELGKTE